MKISYNWLKQYANTTKNPEEISAILTETGLEVEGVHKIEAIKGGLEGVVIGQVLTCEQHPDADRLKVTTVTVGGEPLKIVCGASNVAAGQKVIVATVGATLYPSPDEPLKIKSSKIRGVESEGMLCAEDELGMGNSHDGILVLDDHAVIGTPAANYFELEDDYMLEIGLTPNRADAMGHFGVARDLAAYLNVHENNKVELNLPSVEGFKIDNKSFPIEVTVENKEACRRYTGVTIQNVKVQASPAWLQKRLRAIGLSPINNVVDVTNFVMHELGTPLHAFDADQLNGRIVVKNAVKNAKFVTLDEVERVLDSSNLMITNGDENLCIAGIYGGLHSGVKDTTTTIFLESAYFDAVSVRKTAKMHGLNTDSSFRFERGVDPNMTLFALKRAALLIKEVAGGSIAMDVFDSNPEHVAGSKIEFSYDRCNRLIGNDLKEELVDKILMQLDFQLLEKKNGVVTLQSPAYRVDVLREADVIEEVLRIYGFNKVELPEKLNSSINYFAKPDKEKIQTIISEFLVGNGYSEAMNNSLTKSSYVNDLGGEVLDANRNVAMLNPLSQDLNVMRQSLLFNVLEMVAHNQNRQNSDLRIFEFGKTYHKYESGYAENKRLIIALTGAKENENWNSTSEKVSYYDLKGLTLSVLNRLGLKELATEKPLKKSLLQDGQELFVLKNKIGEMGWLSKEQRKYFGVKNDVFVADLNWDAIIESLQYTKVKYAELPKTFAVRRDFSLLLDEQISFSEIEAIAKECDKKILKEVGLFDVYEGDKLEKGKKSYAVSFKFQDQENTLKDQQVDSVMEAIRKQLESKLNAQLRS